MNSFKQGWMRTLLMAATACMLLSACADSVKKKAAIADSKTTLRLTLLPLQPITPEHTVSVDAKLSDIENRTLIMNDDLVAPLQLWAVDTRLSDFHAITPQASATPGLYRFDFTPVSGAYRVFAHAVLAAPAKNTLGEQFPRADLGAYRPGAIDKTQRLTATMNGYRFALSWEKHLTEGEENRAVLQVTDVAGHEVKASGSAAVFYEDLRHVAYLPLVSGQSVAFTPAHAGFVKVFVQIPLDKRAYVVPFGMTVSESRP